MADDPPPVVTTDTKVNKSRTESLDCSAVTDNSNMPLTPKHSNYEPLKSLSDIKTTRDLTSISKGCSLKLSKCLDITLKYQLS